MRKLLQEISTQDAYTKFYADIPEDDFNSIVSAAGMNKMCKTLTLLLNAIKAQEIGVQQAIDTLNAIKAQGPTAIKACDKFISSGEIKTALDLFANINNGGLVNKTYADKCGEGLVVLHESNQYKITCTLTYEANKHYFGGKTRWCTASDRRGHYDGFVMFGRYIGGISYKGFGYIHHDYDFSKDEEFSKTTIRDMSRGDFWYNTEKVDKTLIQIQTPQNIFQIEMGGDGEPGLICDANDKRVLLETVCEDMGISVAKFYSLLDLDLIRRLISLTKKYWDESFQKHKKESDYFYQKEKQDYRNISATFDKIISLYNKREIARAKKYLKQRQDYFYLETVEDEKKPKSKEEIYARFHADREVLNRLPFFVNTIEELNNKKICFVDSYSEYDRLFCSYEVIPDGIQKIKRSFYAKSEGDFSKLKKMLDDFMKTKPLFVKELFEYEKIRKDGLNLKKKVLTFTKKMRNGLFEETQNNLITEMSTQDAYTKFYAGIPQDDFNSIVSAAGMNKMCKTLTLLLNAVKTQEIGVQQAIDTLNAIKTQGPTAIKESDKLISSGKVKTAQELTAYVNNNELVPKTHIQRSADGLVVLFEDERGRLTCTLTQEANKHYFGGRTRWCTASGEDGNGSGIMYFGQYIDAIAVFDQDSDDYQDFEHEYMEYYGEYGDEQFDCSIDDVVKEYCKYYGIQQSDYFIYLDDRQYVLRHDQNNYGNGKILCQFDTQKGKLYQFVANSKGFEGTICDEMDKQVNSLSELCSLINFERTEFLKILEDNENLLSDYTAQAKKYYLDYDFKRLADKSEKYWKREAECELKNKNLLESFYAQLDFGILEGNENFLRDKLKCIKNDFLLNISKLGRMDKQKYLNNSNYCEGWWDNFTKLPLAIYSETEFENLQNFERIRASKQDENKYIINIGIHYVPFTKTSLDQTKVDLKRMCDGSEYELNKWLTANIGKTPLFIKRFAGFGDSFVFYI